MLYNSDSIYKPEGSLFNSPENIDALSSLDAINMAKNSRKILEGKAIRCDEQHNLIVNLGTNRFGIIPREEGAIGIDDGSTKDIALISKVNKPICFIVDKIYGDNEIILSRRKAQLLCQENYLSKLVAGKIIPATVTHFEKYGSFVDIGCGISSLIRIDKISISRISHPSDRFKKGQNIFAIVESVEENGRICLSHKELLGTWLENAKQFKTGETVCGIVRSITQYGIFVELNPNLAGLSENRPEMNVAVGDPVSVYIKSLLPEKMKAKLTIIDTGIIKSKPEPLKYFLPKEMYFKHWRYSPENCTKIVSTTFATNV